MFVMFLGSFIFERASTSGSICSDLFDELLAKKASKLSALFKSSLEGSFHHPVTNCFLQHIIEVNLS